MSTFSPLRLTLARKRRGFNKTELAARVDLTPRSITGFESKELIPCPNTIDRLANALGFPREFFYASSPIEINPDGASFRSLSTMTAGQRDAVLAAAAIAVEIAKLIDHEFSLPEPNVPNLRNDKPESAAAAMRTIWRLGERKIQNMIHLLEANGVRVFSLAEDSRDVDGFSFWVDNIPYVFLNTLKSGERGRFDAAHELGHLVLHRHGAPQGRASEHEADCFASAFLMPAASTLALAPQLPTVRRLIDLKKHWDVSIMALAKRIYDLGRMTDWQYRRLCIEMSEKGWRTAEPEGIPRETSQVFRKVFASLREEGFSYTDFARKVHISPQELDTLVFRIVLYGVPGSGPSNQVNPNRSKPALRLIKNS